jgi:hypothetical protein
MGKRTNGSGKTPAGQTSRGYPAAERGNPKNGQAQRPDVIGRVPGDGGAALQSTGKHSRANTFQGVQAGNTFDKGGDRTEPNPATVNRGYTEVTPGNVPSISRNTSSNRQRFGIDPGDVAQPNGDTTDVPGRPRYGVGTTGE